MNDPCPRDEELFEERAAIREFDGGMSRKDAERLAEDDVERHRKECLQRFAATVLEWADMDDKFKRPALNAYRKKYGDICTEGVLGMVKAMKAGKVERTKVEQWRDGK